MTIATEVCCASLEIKVFDTLFEVENPASYGFCVGVANSRWCLILNKAGDCVFFHWFAMYYMYLGQLDAFVVKGTFKKVLAVLSIFVILSVSSLKLAKSLIIRGIYLGIFCSMSKLFC